MECESEPATSGAAPPAARARQPSANASFTRGGRQALIPSYAGNRGRSSSSSRTPAEPVGKW